MYIVNCKTLLDINIRSWNFGIKGDEGSNTAPFDVVELQGRKNDISVDISATKMISQSPCR